MYPFLKVTGFMILVLAVPLMAVAQPSGNDTIRLGAVQENGRNYPMVLLPEFEKTGEFFDPEARRKHEKLRYDIFVVYPYALTAASVFKDVNTHLDQLDSRRDRKHYLKSMDRALDAMFKEPLKNLSVDQGHVLIKLIDRQTGENCYSIIRELKNGFSAVLWQSVGMLFNNNLARDYDPDGRDREVEGLVKELEASNAYRYQLFQQQELLKKIARQQ